MERGVKTLVWLLLSAMLLGAAVIMLHPTYRATARALWRGEMEVSPIWQSNAEYYRDVAYETDEPHDRTK
jgi:hypothetical protein